jgi:hypothetical protein
VQGIGFVLREDEAGSIVANDPHSENVIVKYIVGNDINNCPRQTGSRWVINFWTLNEDEARAFKTPWAIVEERVRPYRDSLTRQVHETCFWKFWDRREVFYNRIRHSGRVLVASKLSKHFCVTFGDPSYIYSEKVKLFDLGTFSAFSILQSAVHAEWALLWGSTTGEGLAYVGTSCFDTFPFPSKMLVNGSLADIKLDIHLENAGISYFEHRASMCQERQLGFTGIYNLVHMQENRDDDVMRFRNLIAELDQSVFTAYGWSDINPNHQFIITKHGERYAVAAGTRAEILKRLSALNQERFGSAVNEVRPHTKMNRTNTAHATQDAFDFSTPTPETVASNLGSPTQTIISSRGTNQ